MILILYSSLINFSSCSFFSGASYEYIRFISEKDSLDFEKNCKGQKDFGYYYLYAENYDGSINITISFPETTRFNFIYIPYDYNTFIMVNFKNLNKIYKCSSFIGSGKIYLESVPDSFFSQLSGSFEGILLNTQDHSESLRIDSGEFLFYFNQQEMKR
ncbi:MAG: hypothetical protein ABIN39_02450 [candidate division WOR-3 bacterium]